MRQQRRIGGFRFIGDHGAAMHAGAGEACGDIIDQKAEIAGGAAPGSVILAWPPTLAPVKFP
jgi:hypothetical protein